MFELGTTDHWWEIAKRYPVLSNHPNILKPLGYAHIVNLIETFKPKTILEVGHGSGTYLFQMFKNNKNIEFWGLDDEVKDSSVSVEDLKNVRAWNPHVKFVSGLLGNNVKELPDNYFDLVYSVSVIEHIPHENLPAVFEETYRILKPGGIVSHSYDIFYNQNTKAVFDAYEDSKLIWLKRKETMNVFWEEWLEQMDFESLVELFEKVVFENPIFVAEKYMWQQERLNRIAPMNYLTVLTAARKPENESVDEKAGDKNRSSLPISNLSDEAPDKIFTPENFDFFTYSKKNHFNIFLKNNGKELFKQKVDPNFCDIKVFQDLLVYSFIKHNVPKGSKILEVGGGRDFSRIIDYFKNEYECWKIEKSDTTNADSIEIETPGYKLVNDYIGNFNEELPNNYFDFVFSISTFRYDSAEDLKRYENILKDINRILKPGAYTIHCVVALWKGPVILAPQILPFFFKHEKTINEFVPMLKVLLDPDLFFISEKYYEENWQPFTGKTYKKFGKPFSYNLMWQSPID